MRPSGGRACGRSGSSLARGRCRRYKPAMSVEALSQDGTAQPVQLGPLTLANRYFLAPLAGVSDWPFRLLCREMGASIAHTEMISSHGLVHGGDQTLSYLERPASERPFAIQVFGTAPEGLADGALRAAAEDGPTDALAATVG